MCIERFLAVRAFLDFLLKTAFRELRVRLAGLGIFLATAFFRGFLDLITGGAFSLEAGCGVSVQPWASRTAIIAARMSFQVCGSIMT